MKAYLIAAYIFLGSLSATATSKDSTVHYNLPDSVKAVQFMAEVNIKSFNKHRHLYTGIITDVTSLEVYKNGISFGCYQAEERDLSLGKDVNLDIKTWEMRFKYDLKENETYKLLISQATDSANNFSIYSGYVFLPREQKWKWIGTGKIKGRWNSIKEPRFSVIKTKKQTAIINIIQVWIQRQNGSWKNLKEENQPWPAINLYSHIDSVVQHQTDIKLIEDAIVSGKTDVKQNEQGVYYTIMKEGTGRQVSLSDTVTVFYKGSLLSDGSVFDQTKDKPATFPLKRLIRGWQIGVPLCKVGGKIKLVIPSDLAYSIRTRSAKIPPNSILVFEIEVVDAKPPQ